MSTREGNLEAPTRHPVDWKNPDFYDADSADKELERVFDICHGCRRCVSLCQSFPTLFDLIDATADGEVHGVAKAGYAKVVDQCYLCYMTSARTCRRTRGTSTSRTSCCAAFRWWCRSSTA